MTCYDQCYRYDDMKIQTRTVIGVVLDVVKVDVSSLKKTTKAFQRHTCLKHTSLSHWNDAACARCGN